MADIGQNDPSGIGKCGNGFNESDTVPGEIGNFLRLVPFKMFTEIGQAIFYLKLQLFRVGYQIRDAHEQPPGRAAVNHAMIEAQREVRFHHRHEPVLARVPTGCAPGGADAEHQRLFRQRDGRGPGQSERAKVRHSGNGTTRHFRRQLALPRQFDQFVVRPDQIFQRPFVRAAKDGNQHAFFRFNGERGRRQLPFTAAQGAHE